MIELTIYNARKHFRDKLVLHDAGFRIFEGEKAGLVGVNGSGKSTILKLLAGIELMDVDYRKICEGKSRITITNGATVGYLEQIPSCPGNLKVKDVLNLAFNELYDIEEHLNILEEKMKHLQGKPLESTLKKYSKLQMDYNFKGGYDKEEKFSKVCTGLKFDNSFLHKDFNVISGGEKTSVMLGKILLESPDVLLLDEPTNHLDIESTEWLEGCLKEYKGIVIVVSHDRYFLDKVVTKTVELENGKCVTYEGNYSEYVNQKEKDMLLQFEKYKEQQKNIKSMQNTIKDLRDWAARADNKKFFRRAASMQKKLDKMEKINKPSTKKQNIRFDFKDIKRSGNDVIIVEGLSKRFEDKCLLQDVDLNVFYGDKIAVIGPNGCGKTTFLKILLKELNADGGSVKFGANVKLAYLPQNIKFKNEELTVLDCFREDRIIEQGKAREYLAKFMFFGGSVFKKVKQLSGGEKVRLKLCMLFYGDINMMILDEPTNHLDIDSIEILEEALDSFKGTILFISHDRYFINRVCNRVTAVEDMKLKCYEGNYDLYKKKKSELSGLTVLPTSLKKKKHRINDEIEDNKEKKNESALEGKITKIEGKIRSLDEEMHKAGDDYEKVNELFCKRERLNEELEEAMGIWHSVIDDKA